ncbi:MAG TPA: type II secretion system inner membrane protein GspF [Burkholderiales bacterium]|jgi:general secretion pathway protein F|nr:type II secretion system inner membrane protein GspF [Burkholderiales bacterium]
MATFRYEAARANARIESGELEADSARAARTALRARGLLPISVEPAGSTGAKSREVSRNRLPPAELALATRQLASLISAGLPLDLALSTLAEQADSEAQREVFRTVRSDVASGYRLADALARHPRVFPQVYCATVAAGEQAGSFGTVLERLAQYLEDRQALRTKLVGAATYPAIVAVVAFGIVLFLMTYVVPQVVQVFEQTRQVLPWPTRLLLAVSAFLETFGLWLLLGLGAALWGVRAALRRPGPKTAWDRRVLSLPLFGRLVQGIDSARFAATMAMLTEAGVPILRALAAAQATLGNSVLRGVVREAIERVREGSSLGRALAQAKVFPPVLIRLIEVGEATGQLPQMLAHAARNQTREVERRATALATLLEPVLILVMGAVVLGIVLAVLMPIIEINQLVR